MGTFRVGVTLGNPDSDARETVNALVDTGATFSVMPTSLLRRLGIQPARTRRLRLANGRTEERQTGMAFFEVAGIDAEVMVVFGPENIHLLGATTLEALLLIVDPINKQLIPEDGLLMWGDGDGTC
ncbi:MAG: retroviral-like aspartic protease family protein [Dehalococcoidia bacterium]|nr:retroviral-like aspartic protease family protein [Dehalococcoidia bacterium]